MSWERFEMFLVNGNCQIWAAPDRMYIDTYDPKKHGIQSAVHVLADFFEDKAAPTQAERELFKLEFDKDYPTDRQIELFFSRTPTSVKSARYYNGAEVKF